MSKLIYFNQTYSSLNFKVQCRSDVTRKQMGLLVSYLCPTYMTMFGIPTEDIDAYYNRMSAFLGLSVPDSFGLASTTETSSYAVTVNNLFKNCPQENLERVANMTINEILGSYTHTLEEKQNLLLFMPDVFCNGCENTDELFFYWYPYQGIRKTELREFIRSYDCDLIGATLLEVDTCPACQPRSYQSIVTSAPYINFSNNAQSNCRCAGCGRS